MFEVVYMGISMAFEENYIFTLHIRWGRCRCLKMPVIKSVTCNAILTTYTGPGLDPGRLFLRQPVWGIDVMRAH